MKDQVLPILRSAYEDLTKSEKKIADYITGHKDEIMGQTVAEIAKNTANSEITISRFCKKLGFSGLQGLKIALATELSAAGEQSYQDINAARMNVLTGQKIETGTYCSHLQNRFRTNGWES